MVIFCKDCLKSFTNIILLYLPLIRSVESFVPLQVKKTHSVIGRLRAFITHLPPAKLRFRIQYENTKVQLPFAILLLAKKSANQTSWRVDKPSRIFPLFVTFLAFSKTEWQYRFYCDLNSWTVAGGLSCTAIECIAQQSAENLSLLKSRTRWRCRDSNKTPPTEDQTFQWHLKA